MTGSGPTRRLINRLNVYPVPDGDTGTNMALTLESVTEELDGLGPPDMAPACRAIAHGSLMGARGNSGVILSQLLRGIVRGPERPDGPPGPHELAKALTMADKLAREAVMRPVEGTILTVARGAADGARAAAEAGRRCSRWSRPPGPGRPRRWPGPPSLLPVLAQAGVVDAGGTGYLLLFDALLTVVDGRACPIPPDAARHRVGPLTPGPRHGRTVPVGSDAAAEPPSGPWPASATR